MFLENKTITVEINPFKRQAKIIIDGFENNNIVVNFEENDEWQTLTINGDLYDVHYLVEEDSKYIDFSIYPVMDNENV